MSQWQQTCRGWPDIGTFVPTGKKTKKEKKPKPPKGGCIDAAEYASLAIAEASGDNWCDGAVITITGGAVFKYTKASEQKSGPDVYWKGLAHIDPFNAGATLASTVVSSSEPPSDPNDWAYTDQGAGTQGVSYDLDTVGSDGRIRRFTAAPTFSPYYTNDVTVGIADKMVFAVFDDIQVLNVTGSGVIYLNWRIWSSNNAETAMFYPELRVDAATATNYTVFVGGSTQNSGIPYGTKQRIWWYQKDSEIAVWLDDNATPAFTGAGLQQTPGSSATASSFYASAISSTCDTTLGTHVLGRLVF